MKLRTIVTLFLIFGFCIGFIGCKTIFQANFEWNGPIDLLPDAPSTDVIKVKNSVSVIVSPLHNNSKALRMIGNGGANVWCIAGEGPHTSGKYTIKFKASRTANFGNYKLAMGLHSYSGDKDNPIIGIRAFSLYFYSGKYHLRSGNGDEALSGVIPTPNVVQKLKFEVDMDTKTFSVIIDGKKAAIERKFIHSDFNNFGVMYFSYNPSTPAGDEYFIDDIIMRKQ